MKEITARKKSLQEGATVAEEVADTEEVEKPTKLSLSYRSAAEVATMQVEAVDITQVEAADTTQVEAPDITQVEALDITRVAAPDITQVEVLDITLVEVTHSE